MCPSTNEALRQRSRSYTVDIMLAGAVILLVCGGSYLTYRAEYLGGASNEPNQGMILFFPFLVPMLLATFIAFICYLARLFPSPPTLGHWLVRLVFLLFPPTVLFGSFALTTPLADVFLKGFEQWVTREADIDAIQEWLASDGHRFAGQSFMLETDANTPEELPTLLTALRPWRISFSDGEAGSEMSVELWWPCGFSDEYGLIIGPPTMHTPKTGMIRVRAGCNEFRRAIRPGVYIFNRG